MLSLRDGIADGIDLVSRHYTNFAPTNDRQLGALIDDYARELGWANGETALAGFRLALQGAGKFAPKFPEILAAVKHAERIRNGGVGMAPVLPESVICALCGTEALEEVPHPKFPDMPARLWPSHRSGCPLRLRDAA